MYGSPPMRIETATGRPRPVRGMGLVSSGQFWRGLRLEGISVGPDETDEGYFTQHFVGVVGSQVRIENSWAGSQRRSRQYFPGNVAMLPAMVPYAARWEGFKATGLFLDPDLLAAASGEPPGARTELRPAVAPQNDALLADLILTLRSEVQAGFPGGALYGESLGVAIAAHVVRGYAVARCGVAGVRRGLQSHEVRRIEEYVEENLARNLSLHELSQQLGMNLYFFVRSFKRSTGLTPHQYVLRRRVERAKALLLEHPGPSIADIALRCGFATQSHLTAAFNRLTNVTPGEYRRTFDRARAEPMCIAAERCPLPKLDRRAGRVVGGERR
jgi:AraC family transcriptional regulator